MGLDCVELVMAIEEAFGIDIPDADAANLITVGAMYEFVLSRLKVSDKPGQRCLTAHAFYRTRSALVRACPNASLQQITPRTPLLELYPEWTRRRIQWRALEHELKLKTPDPFCRHPWLAYLCYGLCGSITVYAPIAYLHSSHSGMAAQWDDLAIKVYGALVGGFLGSALVIFLSTQPLRFSFGTKTVGWVARRLAYKNGPALVEETGGAWTRKSVWDTLRHIIMEQTGSKEHQIVPEASFVQDLGLD